MITFHRTTINEGDTFALNGYKFKILKLNKTLPELVEVKLESESAMD
jgi:hypothetical protein